jgi:tetratricopeptide (TPR) repeat protein
MPAPSDDVVLVLGAGASLPAPAGGPLFAEVRDACAERVGVRTADWPRDDPRRALLDHVIPEVFLKLLADADYRFDAALAAAVAGTPGTGPNAVHELAARVLAAGGTVWTTNWDRWIEDAYLARTGQALPAAVNGSGPPPAAPPVYGKLHGTAADPPTLMFRTPQIIRPLGRDWHDALVASCRGRTVFVAGYAGADVDLFPALDEALGAARAAYWLEGVGDQRLDDHAQAAYETWRFRLDGPRLDPSALPAAGRHLVWCGAGSAASDPSRGLLDALGDPTAVGRPPSWDDRYAAVAAQIRRVEPTRADRGRRLVVRAVVRERLADRRGAAARHAAAVIVGSPRDRRKALAALRNLVLLRAQPLRLLASRAYGLVAARERAEFVLLHAGGTGHDPARAAAIADGRVDATIDDALNAAMATRWSGDLRVAERIARAQLARALAQDLASQERDWPERISRASFELAQALVWQGAYDRADDVCRTAHMRVSGAKWTAWEFAMRATVRFAHGQYDTAERQFAEAETILRLEGFADFALTVVTGRSACLRAQGDLAGAARHLGRAERWPRKGKGSAAAILAERAELRAARGDPGGAAADWRALARSPLPLWSGIGHMRLAETGADPDANGRAATAAFAAAGSAWGAVRAQALADRWPRSEIERRADGLGPAAVFAPRSPWLM